MFIRRSRIGALPLVICCLWLLVGAGLAAQQPAPPDPDDRAARLDSAAHWLALDSSARAAPLYRSVLHDAAGRLIVDSLTGLAYHKLGVIAYRDYDDAGAAHYYRRAIAVRDAVFSGPHNDRAHSRSNLATPLRYLGRLDSAATVIREANAIYEGLPGVDSTNWLRSLNELGEVADELRDYRIAYSSSYRAVALLERMHAPDPVDAFNTYFTAGRIISLLDEPERAEDYARRALAVAERHGDAVQGAHASLLLASVLSRQQRHAAALPHYERAVATLLRTNPADPQLGYAYLDLAQYHGQRREFGRAYDYADRAREIFTREAQLTVFYGLDALPEFYRAAGRHVAALDTLNARLDYLQLTDTTHDNRKLLTGLSLLETRAAVLTDLGRTAAALADYRRLFALQDRLRSGVSSDDSRRYLSRNLRPLFNRAIELQYRQYAESRQPDDLWAAFGLSERARAYSLLANLQRNRAGRPQRERELRETIADLERSVSQGQAQLQMRLEGARLQLDRLLNRTEVAVGAAPAALDRAALTDHLRRADCQLLTYHLGDSTGVAFLLAADGTLSGYRIKGTATLPSQINGWREAIRASAYRRKSLLPAAEQSRLDGDYLRRGRALTEQLFPPELLAALEGAHGSAGPAQVCVVPDGALNYLPFAALPLADAAPPLDYGRIEYLHNRFRLRYTYSARYLLELASRPPGTYDCDLLAYAPTFGAGAERSERREARAALGLHPLRYNREEVERISDFVADARAYYGPEANRERFLQGLGRARILHLSSHGTVNATDPNLSFVAFTQVGDSLQDEELLYFNDLYTLPLDNELTVLSACETSIGQLAPGETALSLAAALATAGARSTLTTLWEVDDRATMDLIVSFYRRLVDGEGRSAALAGAQRELLDGTDFAHPYYWSAMTLYGAGGGIDLGSQTDGRIVFWGVVAALLFGVLALLSRRMRPSR